MKEDGWMQKDIKSSWLRRFGSYCAVEPRMEYVKVFQWMYFLCVFVHAGCCLLGAVYQVNLFVYYNLFSTILYMLCAYMAQSKHILGFCVAGPLAILEVIGFVTLGFYCFGWECGYQYYLTSVIMMLFFFPFRHIRFSMLCACFVGGYFTLLLFLRVGYVPRYVIDGMVVDWVKSINLIISIGIIIALTYMFAKQTRKNQASLQQENLALQELADTDPLTGLSNRRSMEESLEQVRQATEMGESVAVLALIDIDDFKQINDTYGHTFGDRVLVNTANVVQDIMKDKGMACRWGGEELLLLFENITLQEAHQTAKSLCSQIANLRYACDRGNTVNVTVTCGLSQVERESGIEKAIIEADNNLYIGKMSGKNCVISQCHFVETK